MLLIIYVLVFGQQSLQRYLDKSAVITKHEEDASLYSSPGLVFSILYLLKQFLLDVEQYCTTCHICFYTKHTTFCWDWYQQNKVVQVLWDTPNVWLAINFSSYNYYSFTLCDWRRFELSWFLYWNSMYWRKWWQSIWLFWVNKCRHNQFFIWIISASK